MKTIGENNKYIQNGLFNEDIQPALYIMNSDGLIGEPYYKDNSLDSFKAFLLNGIIKYKE